jgi:protein-disulfide isomerase
MRGKGKRAEEKTADATGAKTSSPSYPAGISRGKTKSGIPWIGGPKASVVIEVFSDFGCPFCQVGANIVHKLLEKYGSKIKVKFYQVPITSLHPDSMLAAQASLAAQAQGKFWQMHDLLYANRNAQSRADLIKYASQLGLDVERFKRELDSGKYKARIKRELAIASKRKVEGTPTFFVNGQKIEGAAPIKTFQAIIDRQLE